MTGGEIVDGLDFGELSSQMHAAMDAEDERTVQWLLQAMVRHVARESRSLPPQGSSREAVRVARQEGLPPAALVSHPGPG